MPGAGAAAVYHQALASGRRRRNAFLEARKNAVTGRRARPRASAAC
jgi:hypothetical protein